nr:hypothetical protein [Actinoplanes deccanensis]
MASAAELIITGAGRPSWVICSATSVTPAFQPPRRSHADGSTAGPAGRVLVDGGDHGFLEGEHLGTVDFEHDAVAGQAEAVRPGVQPGGEPSRWPVATSMLVSAQRSWKIASRRRLSWARAYPAINAVAPTPGRSYASTTLAHR